MTKSEASTAASVVQPRTHREQRLPLYFGPGRSLFGCFHEPAIGPTRSAGIVLCCPLGQEYIRIHRSYVQLASRLAGAGFAVLRFDYLGCGDSAGSEDQGRIGQWIEDTGSAVDELRQRHPLAAVGLVGVRLGATLAAFAAASRADVDSLVLWDPVVLGADYLAELRALQREMLGHAYVTAPRGADAGSPEEVLGFPLPEELRRDIAQIDLLALAAWPGGRNLIVESEASGGGRRLHEDLIRRSQPCEYRHLPDRIAWLAEPSRGIIPHRLLESVVSWLTGVYP